MQLWARERPLFYAPRATIEKKKKKERKEKEKRMQAGAYMKYIRLHSQNWVSRFGLAVAGKLRDLGSNPLRLSFLFKNCGLWTLSCDFVHHSYETLKWLSSLPILMQGSFWWWQCSDRYIISLSSTSVPRPPPPPSPVPNKPFTVSVDVKLHVYSQKWILSSGICNYLQVTLSACRLGNTHEKKTD